MRGGSDKVTQSVLNNEKIPIHSLFCHGWDFNSHNVNVLIVRIMINKCDENIVSSPYDNGIFNMLYNSNSL